MNLSAKALWIAGGIAVVVIVCCIALGIALHSAGKVEDRQQADIKSLSNVRDADNSAQLVNDAAKKKADEDAQQKIAIINGVQNDLDDADFVHGLQRGLRKGNSDGCDSSAGQPSGTVPRTDNAAGADEHVRP